MNTFLKKFNYIMTSDDKYKIGLIIIFSITVSLIELIGISAIMPFISIINDNNYIHTNHILSFLYDDLHFSNNLHFIAFFGFILIFFYVLRALMIMLYFYIISKFARGKYVEISQNIFHKILYMPYTDFVNTKSSHYMKSIVTEAYNFTTIITAFLNIFTEVFVVLLIYSMMLYVETQLTLFITLILLLSMFFLIKIVSKKIKQAGTNRDIAQKSFFDIVSNTFGNYKIVKLSKNNLCSIEDKFSKSSVAFSNSNIVSETVSQVPRVFLESITFIIIILIILYLVFNSGDNLIEKIPALTMLLLGLYRLMPSVNRILTAYGQIIYAHRSLDIIYDIYHKPIEKLDINPVEFKNNIKVKDLTFSYEPNKVILNNVNLKIKKGEKIAFIGPSGSGKSTIVDIIIGLISLESSNIFIDGKVIDKKNIAELRNKIGYIPQAIYLFDGTVAENVCLGHIRDDEKLKDVLKKAKIYDFLMTKEGLETEVGDSGIKLSGGQKQRIAIARALYTDPDILILDEATSALDENTEKEIMNEIMSVGSNKTLIIIAHRLNTIEKCDKIYEIKDGSLNEVER